MRARAFATLLVAMFVGGGSIPAVTAAAVMHSITGTVTDTSGQGVGGIYTYACPTPPPGGLPSCASGVTAADGTFSIAGVAPGAYDVSVADPLDVHPFGYYSAAGFTQEQSAATTVTVGASDVAAIDIQFPVTYTITGTITDPTGHPDVEATVYACLPSECGNIDAFSATDGTYSIPVIAGSYTVEAFDVGNYPQTFYSSEGTDGPTTTLVVNGDVSQVNIQFSQAKYISGRVIDTKGIRPGAFISISACETISPATCFGAPANADGTFRVAVPPATFTLSVVNFDDAAVPGYWSSNGLVATAAAATPISTVTGNRSGIVATIGPIGISAHAGTAISGSFTTHLVTVRAGTYVTVRFGLGTGFAGAKVSIWMATGSSATKFGTFRRITTRSVSTDGNAYYPVRVHGYVEFRATYSSPSSLEDPAVTSPTVVARGT